MLEKMSHGKLAEINLGLYEAFNFNVLALTNQYGLEFERRCDDSKDLVNTFREGAALLEKIAKLVQRVVRSNVDVQIAFKYSFLYLLGQTALAIYIGEDI